MDITDRAGARFSNASQESLKLNTPNCAPDSRNGGVHLAQSPLDGWQSGEFSSEVQHNCLSKQRGGESSNSHVNH